MSRRYIWLPWNVVSKCRLFLHSHLLYRVVPPAWIFSHLAQPGGAKLILIKQLLPYTWGNKSNNMNNISGDNQNKLDLRLIQKTLEGKNDIFVQNCPTVGIWFHVRTNEQHFITYATKPSSLICLLYQAIPNIRISQ